MKILIAEIHWYFQHLLADMKNYTFLLQKISQIYLIGRNAFLAFFFEERMWPSYTLCVLNV